MATQNVVRLMRSNVEASLLVFCLFLASALQVQAQAPSPAQLKSIDSCQEVVKEHLRLSESTISSALRQLVDTKDTMEMYVMQWGTREAAGKTDPLAQQTINACRSNFTMEMAKVVKDFERKLRDNLQSEITWYDDKIFGLLTDVITEQTMAKVVQSVESHLKPTITIFENVAIGSLKQSIDNMKPAYQTVSRCIRGLRGLYLSTQQYS